MANHGVRTFFVCVVSVPLTRTLTSTDLFTVRDMDLLARPSKTDDDEVTRRIECEIGIANRRRSGRCNGRGSTCRRPLGAGPATEAENVDRRSLRYRRRTHLSLGGRRTPCPPPGGRDPLGRELRISRRVRRATLFRRGRTLVRTTDGLAALLARDGVNCCAVAAGTTPRLRALLELCRYTTSGTPSPLCRCDVV